MNIIETSNENPLSIVFVVVIYNLRFEDSPAIFQILKFMETDVQIELVVCNNSDTARYLFEEERGPRVTLLPMGGNKGISVAFNCAIDSIDCQTSRYLVFLDQDTRLSPDYLSALLEMIGLANCGLVFAPRVIDKLGQLSPFRVTWRGGARVIQGGSVHPVGVINSGLCIRSDIARQLRFDEDLFLDFVDLDFFQRFKTTFGLLHFCHLPTVLEQDFSGSSIQSAQSAERRFGIYCRDFLTYSRKYGRGSLLPLVQMGARAVRLGYQHVSLRFAIRALRSLVS